MKKIAAVVLCVSLGGCASVSYITQEYTGVPVTEVRMPDDTYRVFDKPAENKLMITSSIASSFGQGFVKGLTLGGAPTEVPKPLFEAAALQFLQQSGRPSCRIIDAYLLAQPQWEVKYDCTPLAASTAVTVTPSPARRP